MNSITHLYYKNENADAAPAARVSKETAAAPVYAHPAPLSSLDRFGIQTSRAQKVLQYMREMRNCQ